MAVPAVAHVSGTTLNVSAGPAGAPNATNAVTAVSSSRRVWLGGTTTSPFSSDVSIRISEPQVGTPSPAHERLSPGSTWR